MRIGFGVDVHRLEKNRPLFIGGVKIPSEKGAVGHSDADVLIHAICDALLGAANLGDIGFHFSDQDPKFKGIDSKILLRNVMVLVKDKGYSVGNIDATVVLENPKVNPHVPMIKEVLSEILEVNLDEVSIKATTHEKVDSFGNQEAIKSYCVCLLSRNA
ncbi:MAG: 2-C-methyl-D-erythritol 2,4-cyclodiphosphate synthase [Flavobacteriales bacterium]|nr:2-C-methyl-D-erythritol 2,4-cyclodiphosphate synthase [Flavobacteriales bacterium]MBT5932603.1 2-C-methyl-D-erythritol 2,4-cyclodiphosphate synthase [Flavobacteriales bacterium]